VKILLLRKHFASSTRAQFRVVDSCRAGLAPPIEPVKYKKIIFVHGCFWHRHNCKYGRVRPATRTTFWETKLNGNKERDKRVCRELHKMGWAVMIVWECNTRNLPKLANILQKFIIA
jgi:DNA mismatch endonuclease (patch repair protein)